MTSTSISLQSIAIVDPDPSRYTFFAAFPEGSSPVMVFLRSGDEAIRYARRHAARAYVVAVSLPDRSGFDVVAMLEPWARDARFFLVADTYDPEEERLAFQLRRTKYLSRPLDEAWLARLLGLPNAADPEHAREQPDFRESLLATTDRPP